MFFQFPTTSGPKNATQTTDVIDFINYVLNTSHFVVTPIALTTLSTERAAASTKQNQSRDVLLEFFEALLNSSTGETEKSIF